MALGGQPEDRLIPSNCRIEIAHVDSHVFKPWRVHLRTLLRAMRGREPSWRRSALLPRLAQASVSLTI